MSRSRSFEWFGRVKNGRISTANDDRSGRPSTATTTSKVEQVRATLKVMEEFNIQGKQTSFYKYCPGTVGYTLAYTYVSCIQICHYVTAVLVSMLEYPCSLSYVYFVADFAL
jgi:hypothetical protein